MKVYFPADGGLASTGQIWGGLNGGKIDKPINRPWIALNDLRDGDQAVYVGRGNADGSFTSRTSPTATTCSRWWDEPQNYILDLQQRDRLGRPGRGPRRSSRSTGGGPSSTGHVFNDLNSNGKRDPGEPGVQDFTVAIKKRENSLMDRGSIGVTTDADGSYYIENAYPMTQWLVMEAYDDRYYTTGVTYQADNQPNETTVLGAGVDVSVLPDHRPVGPHRLGRQAVRRPARTAASSAPSATTRPATSSTRASRPSRTGSPASRTCRSTCSRPSPVAPTRARRATPHRPATSTSSPPTAPTPTASSLNQYTTENWKRPGADSNANGDGNCGRATSTATRWPSAPTSSSPTAPPTASRAR